jgi:hypothetical protein
MLKELVDSETFLSRFIDIEIPNKTVIKNLIDNELRRKITSNNSKNKLSCFISIKFTMLLIHTDWTETEEERWFNSSTTSLTSTHVLNNFINNVIVEFKNCIKKSHNTSNSYLSQSIDLKLKQLNLKQWMVAHILNYQNIFTIKKSMCKKMMMKTVLNGLF